MSRQDVSKIGAAGILCIMVCAANPVQGQGDAHNCCSLETRNYQVIAVRPTPNRQEHAIGVDSDGRIALLAVDSTGEANYLQTLGFKKDLPEGFPFVSSLPTDQVLTTVRRFSCVDKDWTIWLALTVGFDELNFFKSKRYFSIFHFLYIFRQGPKGNSILMREKFGEVLELTVDDVNGDGVLEIAVQFVDVGASPPTWLTIWQVDPTGNLQPISLQNVVDDLTGSASDVAIGLGDYKHGDTRLYTEQTFPLANGWRIVRKYYYWDKEKKRYELKSEVRTEETTVE